MFGYVRPLKSELKVRQYDEFKSVYCGLCHSLGRRCGPAARFLVNYDLTFLAMLIAEETAPCYAARRCAVSPFKKKRCLCSCAPLDRAADYSVILSYWKLKDTAADEGPVKAMAAGAACVLLGQAYRRAAKAEPEFDSTVRERLAQLGELEKAGCTSLDETADKFASILTAASGAASTPAGRRVLEQILYHVGRTVYILDAADDIRDDCAAGRYNAVAARFGVTDGRLREQDRRSLQETLRHSANLAGAAFELAEPGPWTDILANIIHLGLPTVTELVLSGRWQDTKKTDRE